MFTKFILKKLISFSLYQSIICILAFVENKIWLSWLGIPDNGKSAKYAAPVIPLGIFISKTNFSFNGKLISSFSQFQPSQYLIASSLETDVNKNP